MNRTRNNNLFAILLFILLLLLLLICIEERKYYIYYTQIQSVRKREKGGLGFCLKKLVLKVSARMGILRRNLSNSCPLFCHQERRLRLGERQGGTLFSTSQSSVLQILLILFWLTLTSNGLGARMGCGRCTRSLRSCLTSCSSRAFSSCSFMRLASSAKRSCSLTRSSNSFLSMALSSVFKIKLSSVVKGLVDFWGTKGGALWLLIGWD